MRLLVMQTHSCDLRVLSTTAFIRFFTCRHLQVKTQFVALNVLLGTRPSCGSLNVDCERLQDADLLVGSPATDNKIYASLFPVLAYNVSVIW